MYESYKYIVIFIACVYFRVIFRHCLNLSIRLSRDAYKYLNNIAFAFVHMRSAFDFLRLCRICVWWIKWRQIIQDITVKPACLVIYLYSKLLTSHFISVYIPISNDLIKTMVLRWSKVNFVSALDINIYILFYPSTRQLKGFGPL